MTARNVLRYYGQLKGHRLAALDPAITSWAERLQITAWLDKPVQALSKGMSQKIQFMSTVISKPKVLILDEPFSGLDPVNANVLRDAVLSLRRDGTTIVLSTHDMTVAEKMCDRIFMIFKGIKVLDGTLDDIRARFGQEIIRVRTQAGVEAVRGLPGVTDVVDAGNFQDVRYSGDSQTFLTELARKTTVLHFELTTPSLHDIFVSIAGPESAPASEGTAA